MQFCPKCGALLVPKKDGKNIVMQCTQCKYNSKENVEATIEQTVQVKKTVDVIDEDEQNKILPECEHICEKCGHQKAYYWITQTRASDEPETRFLKCVKCKHTVREYS